MTKRPKTPQRKPKPAKKTPMLPTDEVSYGFDNIAGVLKLSPLLTERYLNAAQKVARLALGTPAPPNGELYRVPDQLDQDVRLEGMFRTIFLYPFAMSFIVTGLAWRAAAPRPCRPPPRNHPI